MSAAAVFGKAAFRKYPLKATRRGPINRALFESWSVALSDYEPAQVEPHKNAIFTAARECMTDYDYNGAISQGTGDSSKVKLRFQTAADILREATG